MHRPLEDARDGCGGTCPGCGGGAHGRPADTDSAGGPAGWRLVGWSAAVFLLPLMTAVAGAGLAGPDRTRQTLGALAGLAAGAGLASGALRWSRRKAHRNLEKCS